MEKLICFMCVLIGVCTFHNRAEGITHFPTIHYMNEECNLTIRSVFDTRIQLTADPALPLKVNWTCTVIVRTDTEGEMLLILFRDFDTLSSENCRTNGLNVYASNGTLMNGPDGDCGTETPNGQFESGGSDLTFQFHTDSSEQRGNFDMLVTAISHSNDTCPPERFHCKNKRCVSVYVTCNGFDDCGDGSDEIQGCGYSSKIVIITVASVLVAAVVVSLIIFIAQYRRRKYRRLTRNSSQHGPHHPHGSHRGGYQNY
ncbi:uncharacterized protein [Haliotis asinina]|uniref:uncharacterized protein n=1 Tax=Haliotis asinina TaxID=109174 RepID=UPI00353277B6